LLWQPMQFSRLPALIWLLPRWRVWLQMPRSTSHGLIRLLLCLRSPSFCMKAALLGEGMIADAAEQQICGTSPHDAACFKKRLR
jgi:hypothetical protein